MTKLNASGSALVYSTYLGGSNTDGGYGIAVDGAGNAYITGYTYSTDFPTAGAFQTSHASDGGGDDVFVTKLNASGTAFIYSTYLGGNGYDGGRGIAVDGAGNAYVTGYTRSTNFPATTGAFQNSSGGGEDTFVTKLNASGSALLYSTYLGGSRTDYGYGIAVDGAGNAYITGATNSTDYPTSAGALPDQPCQRRRRLRRPSWPSLAFSGPLTYNAASNPTVTRYTLEVNSGNLQIVDSTNPSHVLASQPLANTTSISITGASNNTLTVAYSNGDPLYNGTSVIPLTFNGSPDNTATLDVTGPIGAARPTTLPLLTPAISRSRTATARRGPSPSPAWRRSTSTRRPRQ